MPEWCLVISSIVGSRGVGLGSCYAQSMTGDPTSITENGGGKRYPYKVVVRSDTSPNQQDGGHNRAYDNTPCDVPNAGSHYGQNCWGHLTTYDLLLLDNYGNPYGLGDMQESFSNNHNASYSFISGQGTKPGVGYTWHNGQDFVSGKWTDNNECIEFDGETGPNTFWFSFDQVFSSINSPAGKYDSAPYHVQHVQSHCNRT